MHLHVNLKLRFDLSVIFHASTLDTLQPLSAVAQNVVHIGKIDFVAVWVAHSGVDWLVVWATGFASSKQTVTPSDAVRISACYVQEEN
jgi:hypothetical protein